MFQHYLTIAFRNLWRKRGFSLLNISGLAVGIAASLLLFLVIHYETSYDGWQSKKDRIYRVTTVKLKHSNGEATAYESAIPLPLPEALRHDLPQLEKISAMWNIGGAQIHVPGLRGLEDEKMFKENEGLFFAEPSLFEFFDYKWLAGNALGLKDPHTVVLTKSLADTYFGNPQNAMGKMIQMWSFRVPLRVTGVFRDLPANTDVQVRMGASFETFRALNVQGFSGVRDGNEDPRIWENLPWPSECFVLLRAGQDVRQVQAQLPGIVKKYYPPDQVSGATQTSLYLQPLTAMHLDERFYTWKGDALTHKELWSLGLIGLFLLLVACINFVNMATAQSVSRAKEIGVRKVLGSNRVGLLRQFLQETALISFVSLALGCVLARLALPFLSDLMKKPLTLDLWHNPSILLFLGVTGVVVTLLSGFYPGWVLSRFNPIEAIKSKISAKTIGGISLRRGLVVVQFVIAQLLVIGTLVVIRQMKFFRNQPMGFEKKAVALLELPSDSTDALQYGYLKNSLLKVSGVSSASLCMDAPAAWGSASGDLYFENSPVKRDFPVQKQFADSSYLTTFHIGLAEGRVPNTGDSARELMVNETLVRKLGLASSKEALGKRIAFDAHELPITIVGVMHDFNSKSLREAVAPLVLLSNSHAYNYIAFRMDADKMSSTLEQIHKVFTHTYPYYIYDLNFLDERIESFYHTEQITSELFKIFAFLAIFISCLGLYGLVSFMAVQKTKEVGIRKVLGASIQSIVYMFSREFTLLIGVAFVIATPLGYYFMHQWLSGFYYHIPLGWGVFALAIGFSVLIAWITVGYKAVRAALANPVKSLRTE
jgi:putative ABC transport system permease protein